MKYGVGRLHRSALGIFFGCIAASSVPISASGILDLIGSDPFIFPKAPNPSIYFSPDASDQLTLTRTVSGFWTKPVPPNLPFGSLSVLWNEPVGLISYTVNISEGPAGAGTSVLGVHGTCADPSAGTTSLLDASGFVTTEEQPADPLFADQPVSHMSWTAAGAPPGYFCGTPKSGEFDTYIRAAQFKGSDGVVGSGHAVVVDEATQIQFKLRSLFEVFVKRTDGTYHSVTTLCLPGTGGAPDVCIRKSVCNGTLMADANMRVERGEITTDPGGTIQFEGTCVDQFTGSFP